MMAFAQLLKNAVYASLQDGGRKGYMHMGIPLSGFMDSEMAFVANTLVGNQIDDSCLEIYGDGLKLRFSKPTFLGFCSKEATILVNGQPVFCGNGAFSAQSGDVVGIENNTSSWAYLSIQGAWQADKILGSRSMMKGITPVYKLEKGHILQYKEGPQPEMSIKQQLIWPEKNEFIVKKGPEFHLLESPIERLKATISSQSTRQATTFRETFDFAGGEIPSGITTPGTLQLTPGGALYILNRDGQTTGGYYRIGYLDVEDLTHLNRLSPDTQICLTFI